MGERPLTALGIQFRDALPPVLRGSSDYEGILHPLAREVERLNAAIESVRAQLAAENADVMLGAWEELTQLAVGGSGGDIAQRRMSVLSRLQRLLGASEGREWEQQVSAIVGAALDSGWTYEEHVAGDPTTPPAYVLRITLPWPATNPNFAPAVRQIRFITPAHIDIEYTGSTGFLLDVSDLDLEVLAV